MRQVGIVAAAGLYALEHNLVRLAEDHVNARLIAERLAGAPGILLDLKTVQTNIIVFRTTPEAPDAAVVVTKAKENGVLVSAFAPRMVRAVTHMDVSRDGLRARCLGAGRRYCRLIGVGFSPISLHGPLLSQWNNISPSRVGTRSRPVSSGANTR